jgi:hypothetical protein
MNRQNAGAISWILLAVLAGIVVPWLGLATLVALSILWPANQVPHVLLGLWLCVTTAYLVMPLLPGRQLGPSDNWPKRIAYAPLVGPVLWFALAGRS